MAVSEVIAALSANWERVQRRLDEASRQTLNGLVMRFSEADNDATRMQRAHEIGRLLVRALPEEDPVATASREPRLAGSTPCLRLYAIALRTCTVGADDGDPHQRILAAPAVSAFSMRRRGVDPDLPDLIRLDRADGDVVLPAFQFDRDGRPHKVVQRINRLLDAEHDPWGVADWWLSANLWLPGTPAQFIGQLRSDLLMTAAMAAVEG